MNKRTLKDLVNMLLEAKEVDTERKEQIAVKFGLNPKEITSKVVISAELIEQAKDGNLRAIEILREIQKESKSPFDTFLDDNF